MNEKIKTKVLGLLPGRYELTNRVYDPSGIAPTITTCQGGNLEPKIIVDDMYANRDIRVYNKYSPSIRSERSGLKVVEKE